ncbi:hypothetical protein [Paenibacillus sp. JZ16]|uniref:hypothetical protein n=1 Tax=Paenibacillus sp. JZ16 TaxID=1906272 RepID=UPI00188CDC79|nr:hypothetical protein [Paenibacillus sp. JZ16]
MIHKKNRYVIAIFMAFAALLTGCSTSVKQTVPQNTDPESILSVIYDVEGIKSAGSVNTEPLTEISEIEENISIRYQYAFLVKDAVNQNNQAVPDRLYVVSAVENTRKDREISVQYIDGSINGVIAERNPPHLPITVNICPDDSKSPCGADGSKTYQADAFVFSLDQFPAFRSHDNVVDISVKYALGKNKKELREQFLSDSGLQDTDKAIVSLKLPDTFVK